MKNKIFSLIISLFLFLPVNVWAEEDLMQPETAFSQTEDVTIPQNDDEDFQEANSLEESANLPYKQPISKKKLMKKFLIAMLAVGGSSVALYLGLSLYNRVREGGYDIAQYNRTGDTSLETPYDTESAVKCFLEKTKWN